MILTLTHEEAVALLNKHIKLIPDYSDLNITEVWMKKEDDLRRVVIEDFWRYRQEQHKEVKLALRNKLDIIKLMREFYRGRGIAMGLYVAKVLVEDKLRQQGVIE